MVIPPARRMCTGWRASERASGLGKSTVSGQICFFSTYTVQQRILLRRLPKGDHGGIPSLLYEERLDPFLPCRQQRGDPDPLLPQDVLRLQPAARLPRHIRQPIHPLLPARKDLTKQLPSLRFYRLSLGL